MADEKISACVRTDPMYLPSFRAQVPYKMRIIVEDGNRDSYRVHISLSGIRAVIKGTEVLFGGGDDPVGYGDVTCVRPKGAKGILRRHPEATITIIPIEDGLAIMTLSSPHDDFFANSIVTRQDNGRSASLGLSGGGGLSDVFGLGEEQREQTDRLTQVNWLSRTLGTLGVLLLLFFFGSSYFEWVTMMPTAAPQKTVEVLDGGDPSPQPATDAPAYPPGDSGAANLLPPDELQPPDELLIPDPPATEQEPPLLEPVIHDPTSCHPHDDAHTIIPADRILLECNDGRYTSTGPGYIEGARIYRDLKPLTP